jgi:hypothetical protein
MAFWTPRHCLVLSALTWHSRHGIALGKLVGFVPNSDAVMSETELLGDSADHALFALQQGALAYGIQNCF